FMRTGISRKSLPSQAGQGSNNCNLLLLGSTLSTMLLPSSGGSVWTLRPRAKDCSGTSGAGLGGSSLNGLASAPASVSVSGLNDSLPDKAKAVTSSVLPMKFIVVGCPSLRLGKLRLYEVTMVLGIPTISLALRHWPMQGPQAFARTTPFMSLRDCIWQSRSMVARTCSDPGVTRNGPAALMPCDFACSATSAARLMSS